MERKPVSDDDRDDLLYRAWGVIANASGWCDSCRRGFVVVVTRRPMRRHEEEPVKQARHTLEVTR